MNSKFHPVIHVDKKVIWGNERDAEGM
jgi:hypothetical protein